MGGACRLMHIATITITTVISTVVMLEGDRAFPDHGHV